ncbi:MAG: hypothetical protein AAB665_00770 [Patescibacteria group bacterium]
MNWERIFGYIGVAILIYFCGALLYLFLSFNGEVSDKLVLLFGVLTVIFLITGDFHERIVAWFRGTTDKK